MATYVLVHGAWSGAHGFRLVRAALQELGHQVFTPSLTGIGERAHLAAPWVGLGTHVRDLVDHVLYEDLEEVVLLGFSYGGCVVTGAVDRLAARLRHVVFLDAFVPEDGQSVYALLGRTERQPELGEPWLVPPPDRDFDDPAEAAFMRARRTPQPVGTFLEPVRLAAPLESQPFPRTYVRASRDRPDALGRDVLDATAARLRASAAWHYEEIATGHMVASNRPQELARLLAGLA